MLNSPFTFLKMLKSCVFLANELSKLTNRRTFKVVFLPGVSWQSIYLQDISCMLIARCLFLPCKVLVFTLQSACFYLAKCLFLPCKVFDFTLQSVWFYLAKCFFLPCKVFVFTLQSVCFYLAKCLFWRCLFYNYFVRVYIQQYIYSVFGLPFLWDYQQYIYQTG